METLCVTLEITCAIFALALVMLIIYYNAYILPKALQEERKKILSAIKETVAEYKSFHQTSLSSTEWFQNLDLVDLDSHSQTYQSTYFWSRFHNFIKYVCNITHLYEQQTAEVRKLNSSITEAKAASDRSHKFTSELKDSINDLRNNNASLQDSNDRLQKSIVELNEENERLVQKLEEFYKLKSTLSRSLADSQRLIYNFGLIDPPHAEDGTKTGEP